MTLAAPLPYIVILRDSCSVIWPFGTPEDARDWINNSGFDDDIAEVSVLIPESLTSYIQRVPFDS